MKHLLIVALLVLLLLSCTALAGGVSGGILISTVGMSQVNLLIDQYNTANQAAVEKLSFAWGGEADVSMWQIMGLHPFSGVRVLFTSSSAQREKVTSALLGAYIGTAFRIASFSTAADVGIYRGTFSFPAARYDQLSGWGIGVTGGVTYDFPLGSVFWIGIGIKLQWLPVGELQDREGGVYAPREGSFLDFSGIGGVLSITWSGL
jgi:hypothetical protein